MKKIHRVFALLMAVVMALGLITTAFAEPTIDPSKKASLSIYKYDITKASSDGAWDAESYVSTGLHDDAVVDKLAKYAIQGVEFTYLRVADVAMNNEVVDGQRTVGVLYGFDGSDRSNTVLSAIGLTATDAYKTDNGVNYFTSDMLNNKLATALAANATNVKNALEAAVKNGGVAMPETDATGNTSASDMEQGLYLVVETRVPENVTSTCNPFLASLPMTTIDGAAWNYDVTVYPKNQTGNPTLDKTVREAKNSTGKNTGSLTDTTDGYAHTATASVGDTVDYQIISTLPTITSKASSLSEYTYVDTMSKGIRYNKNDVVIEFFKDSDCTDKIATWAENSGKFTVGYLTREGIAAMRSRMTNAIFHEEMKELYIKKDAAYKESIQTAKESLLLHIRMLENSESADPVIEQKLCDLSHALEQVDGKHVYGYLPKEVKAQVDEIVERLAQLPEVAACYDQWWRLKDEIASYYGRNTPPHQPLVQQKEFRTIKNMVIQQAETFRQPVSEQASLETEPVEQQVPWSSESPVVIRSRRRSHRRSK